MKGESIKKVFVQIISTEVLKNTTFPVLEKILSLAHHLSLNGSGNGMGKISFPLIREVHQLLLLFSE